MYRVRVNNNKECLRKLKDKGIQCGIHYFACHLNPIFGHKPHSENALIKSEKESTQTISIPFHENLSQEELIKVVENVGRFIN